MKMVRQVDIQAYVDFLDGIYRQLLRRAITAQTNLGEVVNQYVKIGGELEIALGSSNGWLTDAFAQYLRIAIQRNLDVVKRLSRDPDWEARYSFYIRFTQRLIESQHSDAVGADLSLKGALVQVIDPLLQDHRTLIRASIEDLAAVTEERKRNSGGLLQGAFWPVLQEAHQRFSRSYAKAYRETSEADEGMQAQKKEALQSAAVVGFVEFSALLQALATEFYRSEAVNSASIIKKVVAAYDRFFRDLSPALMEWVSCCERESETAETDAYRFVGDVASVLQDVASQISEHQYSFLSYLSLGVSGIARSGTEVVSGESPFFSSCYTLLFSTVLSVQTGKFDAALGKVEVVVRDKSEIERKKAQHESDQVLEELDTQGFAALSKAQDQRRVGLVIFLACTVILAPFIALVNKHYRKQKQKLGFYRSETQRALRQGLKSMTGPIAQKRQWVVGSLMADAGLGEFSSIFCSRKHLRHSLLAGCTSPTVR